MMEFLLLGKMLKA